MKTALMFTQIAVSLALIVLILIQARGTGLGRSFASSQAAFSRRGLEKLLYKLTFIVAGAFIAVSLLQVLI